jgi:hypothetical protein
LVYKAVYANVCNKPALSNQYLNQVKNKSLLSRYRFVKLKHDNNIKLFAYNEAYKTAQLLTGKFAGQLTEAELKEEKNDLLIWESLRNEPKKDRAGLITTRITSNGSDTSFVFDTGAGISCITLSIAKKFGLKILLDNNIEVESFTGARNKVALGIAPTLRIGGIEIKNAVFLVYPDEAFTFAKGAYVINGIIGFPIAKELGTITIEADSLTFSMDAGSVKEKNLYIDQLRPLVMLTYKGKIHPYNFDTGAQGSLFNKSFFDCYKSELDSGLIITDTTSGAGGQSATTQIMQLEDQSIYLGKSRIQLKKMQIDRESYGIYGKVNFGNIGHDIMDQFKRIIISFNNNYLRLEN